MLGNPQLEQAFTAVTVGALGMSAGINVGPPFEIGLELPARTPEDANAMANGLRMVIAAVVSQNKPLIPLLQQMDLRSEGKLAKLNVSFTAEQLKLFAPPARDNTTLKSRFANLIGWTLFASKIPIWTSRASASAP